MMLQGVHDCLFEDHFQLISKLEVILAPEMSQVQTIIHSTHHSTFKGCSGKTPGIWIGTKAHNRWHLSEKDEQTLTKMQDAIHK